MDLLFRLREFATTYKLEATLFSISILLGLGSLFLFFAPSRQSTQPDAVVFHETTTPKTTTIVVDVAGAVQKPGVYDLQTGARVRDAVAKAGGLSNDVDITAFSQGTNLARILKDQEKVYIPSKLIDSATEQVANDLIVPINLNLATQEELETLPSIGETTAKKIIQSRPITSLEDLVNRKILNKSTAEKLRDHILF